MTIWGYGLIQVNYTLKFIMQAHILVFYPSLNMFFPLSKEIATASFFVVKIWILTEDGGNVRVL